MRLERRGQELSGQAVGALIGALLVACVAVAGVWLHLGLPLPACAFRELTGVPCPTCGSTRLLESLLAGNFAAAVAWNPIVFLILSALASWAALSVIRLAFGLPTWRVVLTRWERRLLLLLVAAAAIASWAYLIWRGV